MSGAEHRDAPSVVPAGAGFQSYSMFSGGRPANAVVLPPGWVLTGSAAPATVRELPDGLEVPVAQNV